MGWYGVRPSRILPEIDQGHVLARKGAMYPFAQSVHNVHMAIKRRPPKPIYGNHFLRQYREDREMTLEEVADAVGMTHAQLSRIERRLQKYNQGLLEALAKLYQTTPQNLIAIHPDQEEAAQQVWGYLRSLETNKPK
jgi:hypothetical protein